MVRVLGDRSHWPGPYSKEAQAKQLQRPYRSRRVLARTILEFVATPAGLGVRFVLWAMAAMRRRNSGATCRIRSRWSRFLLSSKLYALPESLTSKRRARPSWQGPLLDSTSTWACTPEDWRPHPTEFTAEPHVWAAEITIGDRNTFAGLGQGQCRKVPRMSEPTRLAS